MDDKHHEEEGDTLSDKPLEEVERRENQHFQAEIDSLIDKAEEMRLGYMQKHRSRQFASMSFGLLSILAGAAGFGWFFLVGFNLPLAILCMAVAIIPPLMLHFWAEKALSSYAKHYKTQFMPQMAKALGGLKFYPERGISAKIITKTGVIPPFATYKAEDCFMGKYHGVKVIFSEARLYSDKNATKAVFDGIFVLLQTPNKVLDGHTIISADQEMIKSWAGTRWKSLQPVPITIENPEWDKFKVFSDTPEAAKLLAGEKLIKELAEASDVFEKAALTAVLFKEKYIFLMVPYSRDMFEASNVYVPVATKQHAISCKKEIEQILEIIDVFELYKPGEGPDPHAT